MSYVRKMAKSAVEAFFKRQSFTVFYLIVPNDSSELVFHFFLFSTLEILLGSSLLLVVQN